MGKRLAARCSFRVRAKLAVWCSFKFTFAAFTFKFTFAAFTFKFTLAENFYGCIYFPSDKTVSVVPKSRCILRDKFKELCDVEVKWHVQGKQQTFLGIILHTCPKREYNNKICFLNDRNCFSLHRKRLREGQYVLSG